MNIPIVSVTIAQEHDVVGARQRARQLAELLGFEIQDQTRLATAVSEIARNAYRYAGGGKVEFIVETETRPQIFLVRVSDAGPGIADLNAILAGQYRSATGMGLGIIGTKRMMDGFKIESVPGRGTTVFMRKIMPRRAETITPEGGGRLADALARLRRHDPLAEVLEQNQELLRTLDELRRRQEELARLNTELEDTNRGVVALYAELDEKADHLRRADTLKSKFLSNMSHEFRTPLNSILALSRLLLERADGPLSDEQATQIGFIRTAAEDLFELVNDLLDLAKVEAGKVVIRPTEFRVESLFGALRGMLRPLLVNPSLALVFEDAADIPTMQTDEAKVSQILRNFISNALKFTERGEVRVSAELSADGQSVVFSVRDTGIGIPDEEQEIIFREFAQLDSALQRRVKGTGLGLPLTRKFAELLGGSVSLVSEVGVGSTFAVTVPLVYMPATAVAAQSGDAVAGVPEWQPDPSRVQVLVLEESPQMIVGYQQALRGSLFQVLPARSIAEARQLLAVFRPHAIVLDVQLGGEDAWWYLAELKRADATRAIPVMVVSAVEDPEKAIALGADQFARKPVSEAWLLDALKRLAGPESPRRLLIIDDDAASRYLLKSLLRETAFVVSEAGGGREGLAMAREHRPDLIFCDLFMPGMNGVEVLQALQADPNTREIPFVMNTGKVLTAAEREDLHRRGVRILPKDSYRRTDAMAEVRRLLVDAGVAL